MKKYRYLAVFLILILILFAGCGGKDKEESHSSGDSSESHGESSSHGEESSDGGGHGGEVGESGEGEEDVIEDNEENYYTPDENGEKVSVRHILVDTEERAKEVLKLLEEGESFEDVARENSKCPSKLNGGKLEPFGKGYRQKYFEDTAFELEVGEISEPVQTSYGWEIIERLPMPTPTPHPGVRIRHIIVEKEEEIEEIMAELKEGKDFSELAFEKSICPSRAKGGDLGIITTDATMVEPLKEIAFSLEIGEISEPVKTQYGWHIMQRLEFDAVIDYPDVGTLRARHILVRTEKQAKEVLKELEDGADFTRLALVKSVCPTRVKGGDLGEFTVGMLTKPFEQAVINLEIGEFSQPVQTDYGWHIIQRLDLDYKIDVLPQRIRVSQILVSTKKEAEEILQELEDGASFSELAKEKSKCFSSEHGGDLGVINMGEFVKAFNDTAFVLEKGEISEPVKTMDGWHIIMRTE